MKIVIQYYNSALKPTLKIVDQSSQLSTVEDSQPVENQPPYFLTDEFITHLSIRKHGSCVEKEWTFLQNYLQICVVGLLYFTVSG